MTNYNNGKIYKIVCNLTNEVYIGSTTQSLSKRLAQHVQEYKVHVRNNRSSTRSSQIIERGNYNIILIEEVSCNNKEQLHRVERKHIEANTCINVVIPTRTHKEWLDVNKEKVKAQKKIYDAERRKKTMC